MKQMEDGLGYQDCGFPRYIFANQPFIGLFGSDKGERRGRGLDDQPGISRFGVVGLNWG